MWGRPTAYHATAVSAGHFWQLPGHSLGIFSSPKSRAAHLWRWSARKVRIGRLFGGIQSDNAPSQRSRRAYLRFADLEQMLCHRIVAVHTLSVKPKGIVSGIFGTTSSLFRWLGRFEKYACKEFLAGAFSPMRFPLITLTDLVDCKTLNVCRKRGLPQNSSPKVTPYSRGSAHATDVLPLV